MLRTVIYIRKSSDENTEKQIQSLERQWKDLSEFIEKYNTVMPLEKRLKFNPKIDIIEEEHSAKKPWRPKFNSMIESLQKKKYDVILCHELSRLSRNPIDNWMLVHLLDGDYIQTIQTPTSVYTNTPNDKFTLALFLNVAKFENDQRGKNTSSGMQNSKSKGGTTNKANMGYKNAGTTKGNRWIEEDWENYKILKKCWEILLTGDYKITEIYKYAIDRGFTYIQSIKTWEEKRAIPTEWGFRWVFSNPYYKGYIPSDKWLIKGNHQPMVTDEEFEKVQIILQKNWFKHSKDIEIRYENLLENILFCGKTGNPFYVDTSKTRYYCPTKWCSHRYYSAHWPKECIKCHTIFPIGKYKKIENRKYFAVRWSTHLIAWNTKPVSNIDVKIIEDLIDIELKKISIPDKLFQVFRKRLYTLWLEKEGDLKKRISGKKKDIDKKEEEISNIVKNGFSWENVSSSMREWLEMSVDKLKDQIKEIEWEITELKDELDRSFEQAWQWLGALLEAKTVFGKWATESFEPKRRLLLFVFSNLKFIDWEIIPEWKEPFNTIAKWDILTKQKSQKKSEISELGSLWLPQSKKD